MFSKIILSIIIIPIAAVAAEPNYIELIADGAAAKVEKEFRETGVAHRDAHGKGHGCTKAKLTVGTDVPAELKTGLFGTAGEYAAWIRFSNGSGKIQADVIPDGRGMAIKVLGAPGKERAGSEIFEQKTQDFVMINHPVFFVKNAKDYASFSADAGKFFGSHPEEAGIAKAVGSHFTGNPLDTRYFSMASISYGKKFAKYSAIPCKVADKDFLKTTLRKSLSDKPDTTACFVLAIQLQGADTAKFPENDPTVEWSEAVQKFQPVAKLEIPKQDVSKWDERCENMAFTPWNSDKEFTPAGEIQDVRRAVYKKVSETRRKLNGVTPSEPEAPKNVDDWLVSAD